MKSYLMSSHSIHLKEEILCNVVKLFTVTFDQFNGFNVSLLKGISFKRRLHCSNTMLVLDYRSPLSRSYF